MRPAIWIAWCAGLCVGAVAGLRAVGPRADANPEIVRVHIVRTEDGNKREFVVEVPRQGADVISSCECVEVQPGARSGEWRAVVHCGEVPALVTPGVFIYVEGKYAEFRELPCGP